DRRSASWRVAEGRRSGAAGGHIGALIVPPQRRVVHILVWTMRRIQRTFPKVFCCSGDVDADVAVNCAAGLRCRRAAADLSSPREVIHISVWGFHLSVVR